MPGMALGRPLWQTVDMADLVYSWPLRPLQHAHPKECLQALAPLCWGETILQAEAGLQSSFLLVEIHWLVTRVGVCQVHFSSLNSFDGKIIGVPWGFWQPQSYVTILRRCWVNTLSETKALEETWGRAHGASSRYPALFLPLSFFILRTHSPENLYFQPFPCQ